MSLVPALLERSHRKRSRMCDSFVLPSRRDQANVYLPYPPLGPAVRRAVDFADALALVDNMEIVPAALGAVKREHWMTLYCQHC